MPEMENIRRRWWDEVGKSDLLSSAALAMVDSSIVVSRFIWRLERGKY